MLHEVQISDGVHMPTANIGIISLINTIHVGYHFMHSKPANFALNVSQQLLFDEAVQGYLDWFNAGGYGIDTALEYWGSQLIIGEALRRSKRNRSSVFITTKVPCCSSFFSEDMSRQWLAEGVQGGYDFCRKVASDERIQNFSIGSLVDVNLANLGIAYVDLLLLHWPCKDLAETVSAYQELEPLVGVKTRALGVSNFNSSFLRQFLPLVKRWPVVNQCGFSVAEHSKGRWGEDYATLQQSRELNITYMAYSPVNPFAPIHVLRNPAVARIASQHEKSAAQIVLRWLVQQNVPFVAGGGGYNLEARTRYQERFHEILNVFGWHLAENEMSTLYSLERRTSTSMAAVEGSQTLSALRHAVFFFTLAAILTITKCLNDHAV